MAKQSFVLEDKEFEEKLEQIKQRLDTQKKMEKRLDGLKDFKDEKVIKIDQEIASIKTAISYIKDFMNSFKSDINSTVEENESAIYEMRKTLMEFKRKVANMEDVISGQENLADVMLERRYSKLFQLIGSKFERVKDFVDFKTKDIETEINEIKIDLKKAKKVDERKSKDILNRLKGLENIVEKMKKEIEKNKKNMSVFFDTLRNGLKVG